jgi:hypothetical protein
MGDVNPIPIIIIVVASRAFLALMALATTVTGSSVDPADWFFIALGTIPGMPGAFGVVVNVVLFLALTLTPTVWGALLIKRIVNPVAN